VSPLRMLRPGLMLALVLLAACTKKGSLRRDAAYGADSTTVEIGEVPVKGFAVVVNHGDDTKAGELLAVDACFIYVQGEEGSVGIPSKDVESVKVQLYPSTAVSGVVLLTVVGSLSTISHGYYLIFSMPVWLGTGIGSAVSLANRDDIKIDHASPLLYQFARFPQGLPPAWKVGQLMAGAPAGCTTTFPAGEPMPTTPPLPATPTPTPSAPPESSAPPPAGR